MTVAIPQAAPRWSIPLIVLGIVGVIVFFVALSPPGYQEVTPRAQASSELQGGNSVDDGLVPGLSDARIQVVPGLQKLTGPDHRARTGLLLKLGPSDRYVTVGQVSAGSRVEVVGRNDKGDWLAINLTPGAKTYGWVPANEVAGVSNVMSLPVATVNLLR